MGQRKVIESYHTDICNLSNLLGTLVNSYRLLIGGADELNRIALSKKGEVKDALKRAENLGKVIDDIIRTLDYANCNYDNYCKLKSQVMKQKMNINSILTEIDEDVKFKE